MKIDDLVKKYPKLYSNLRMGMFECGNGWYDLLDSFSKEIMVILKYSQYNNHADYHGFEIIKEKFGSLRVQGWNFRLHEDERKEISIIVNKYEELSKYVCEECGAPSTIGRHGSGFWLSNLCTRCVSAKKLELLLR